MDKDKIILKNLSVNPKSIIFALAIRTLDVTSIVRRDGRVVDYSGLENRRTERYRGFESLSLRNELKLKEKRKPTGFRFLFYQVWIGKLA